MKDGNFDTARIRITVLVLHMVFTLQTGSSDTTHWQANTVTEGSPFDLRADLK
jgi:hypothetical protein